MPYRRLLFTRLQTNLSRLLIQVFTEGLAVLRRPTARSKVWVQIFAGPSFSPHHRKISLGRVSSVVSDIHPFPARRPQAPLSRLATMTFSMTKKVPLAVIVALVLLSGDLLPTAQAAIRAVNQCSYALTVFAQNSAGRKQFNLPARSNLQLNLGSRWIGGVIWASRRGNTNNGQATQLEFNISPLDNPTRDFYDISLVNAYNEPAMINPTFLANGDVRNGLECGTPSCTISNLNSVCTNQNYFAGPDNACINRDGPGTVNTPSIDLFRRACPQVYVQSNDNRNVVYACNTGSNYDAIWCPQAGTHEQL